MFFGYVEAFFGEATVIKVVCWPPPSLPPPKNVTPPKKVSPPKIVSSPKKVPPRKNVLFSMGYHGLLSKWFSPEKSALL